MIRSLSKYIKSYLIFYVFFLDKVVECDIINIKLFNKTFNNENKLLNNKVCIKIYRRRKMTKIYTTNIKKGGVGKTTITFNGAFYLAVKKNKRVLLIDLDDSCNLTKRFIDYYEEPIPEISTVKALFSDVIPVPLQLTDHLSIIAGYDHLNEMTKEVEAGEVYMGKVTRLMNFGAFVEVLPGKEGLVHISQLARERVEKVEDVVNVGDEIMVKVIEIDDKGRINLSRKELLK